MKKIIRLLLAGICSTPVMAAGLNQCNVHTWHKIYAQEGQWKITLKSISQEGFFVDQHCNTLEVKPLSSIEPLIYGFGFPLDATFDIAYTVTAVKQEQNAFKSKACVFVVSAKGPAQPDITALNYNGAHCDWQKVSGSGGDFYVG